MNRTWRDHCRPLIASILQEHAGETEKQIRKALKDAYPWGERALHPYKVWCDEIKVQRKKKRFGKRNNVVPKEQLKMF